MINNCLTIDVGTTNTKVTLWHDQIPELKAFPTPKKVKGNLTNFDLEKLWTEIVAKIKTFNLVQLNKVEKIAIASVGESGILINEQKEEVGQCIAWYDERAQLIVDQISQEERDEIYQITGLPLNAHYSACKIAWLLKYDETINEPKDKFMWLCIPDYLVFKLTGNLATENTIASRTLCFDIKNRQWSERIKNIFKMKNVTFPQVFQSGTNLGKVCGKIANLFNKNCQVVIGGHDHMCGATGINLQNSDLFDSTGTTEAIMTLVNQPDVSKEAQQNGLANGIYTNSQLYTRFTAMPSAGSTIAWFMNVFKISEEKFSLTMNQVLEEYNDHSLFDSQVLFFPHFNGSGAPNKIPDSKGMIYGLTRQTTLNELTFGLFLGLTFEFYIAYESMFKSKNYAAIKVIGPAVKDPIWSQLKADILGLRVECIDEQQVVSEGAYTIAMHDNLHNTVIKYFPTQEKSKKQYLNKMLKLYQEIYNNKMKQHL